jgi:hypothetical protein
MILQDSDSPASDCVTFSYFMYCELFSCEANFYTVMFCRTENSNIYHATPLNFKQKITNIFISDISGQDVKFHVLTAVITVPSSLVDSRMSLFLRNIDDYQPHITENTNLNSYPTQSYTPSVFSFLGRGETESIWYVGH